MRTQVVQVYFLILVSLVCICLFFPLRASAAVSVVSTSTSICPFCASQSFAHTVPASSNRLLIVTLSPANNNTTVYTINNVTYGGVALTRASSVTTSLAWGEEAVYYMANPPVGTANIQVTLSNGPTTMIIAGISLAGVNTANPFRSTSTTNNGDVAVGTSAITGTSAAGDLILDIACQGTGISSHGAQQTRLFLINNSANSACDNFAATTMAGSGTFSTSWTFSGSDLAMETALSIRPASTVLSKPANKLGLVGYWSFDEGRGTTATDFSGYGNTGTLTSEGIAVPTWKNGKRGKALNFSVSEVHVNVGNSSVLQLTGPMTACAWVRPEVVDNDHYIIARAPSTSEYQYAFLVTSGGYLQMAWTDNSVNEDSFSTDSPVVKVGRWQYLCGVRNSISSVAIYVDGVSQAISQLTDFAATITTTISNTSIGRLGEVTTGTNWIGDIDEVRLYSRALSAAEIAGLYKSGAAKVGASSADLSNGTPLSNGLVGHWTFDGADVSTKVFDRSGNANDGYYRAGATSSGKVIGKLGQALSFNGTTYVDIPGSASVADNLSDMTVATWFKTTTSAEQQLIGKNVDYGSNPGWAVAINVANVGGPGTPFFITSQNGTNWHSRYVNRNYADGLWHHMVATLSGGANGTILIYIDGTLATLTSYDGVAPATYTTAQTIKMGQNGGLTQPYTGALDDVRIYNRVLSAAEVKQLYQLGIVKIKP